MTLQQLIETALGIWYLPEDDPLPRECPKGDCEYHGEKPVCYSIFFEDCKEYNNESI